VPVRADNVKEIFVKFLLIGKMSRRSIPNIRLHKSAPVS
jgi:hypothetical protein